MMQLERLGKIFQADDECNVIVANTPDLVTECLRLRYQVYCLEKGYEPGDNALETDAFDANARHILLVHRASGQAIGTARVIPPSDVDGLDGLPMTRVCAPGLLSGLPAGTTGEISRFAISKQRRMSCGAGTMIRLGLMQGILRVSRELGLSHWCAVMEPMLLRLQVRNAIYFEHLGPLIEYHGMRQPSCGQIDKVLCGIKFSQWDVWNYITLGGTLWPETTHPQMARHLEFA
jgi:N-acyl-L-homoserine lactone synthetase